jgi:hypothetical protein
MKNEIRMERTTQGRSKNSYTVLVAEFVGKADSENKHRRKNVSERFKLDVFRIEPRDGRF